MKFSLFKKKSKEEVFWNWVVRNKSKLEAFIHSDFEDYRIYNALTKEMRKYNKILSPEMTLSESNELILIITPDGLSDGIVPAQELYDAKPHLENWLVKKFRQPKDDIELNFQGVEYPVSDIIAVPTLDEDLGKADVELYIKDMPKDENGYKSLAFLYLDHIIGEYNTITKLRYIDFLDWNEDSDVGNGISIFQLRKLIEDKLY